MAFSLNELIIYSQKGWLGIQGTGNRLTAPDNLTWYEEQATNDVIVKPTQIWSEFNSIPPAATATVADANVVAAPAILEKRKVRLTPSPNNKAFFAYETQGDVTTALKNWVMPQLIPQASGASSIGYMCRIYNGDPDSGGTEISTTQGQVDALTAWVFNFGAGTLIVSSDFVGIIDPNNLWLVGYRYVGLTGGGAASALSSGSETFPITATDITNGYIDLINSPVGVNDILVFYNGLNEENGVFYTIATNRITFADVSDIYVGASITVKYKF